jgi:hypothetical protein
LWWDLQRPELRVDRDGLLVDWSGRLGTVRQSWSVVGAQFGRVGRRAGGGGDHAELGKAGPGPAPAPPT